MTSLDRLKSASRSPLLPLALLLLTLSTVFIFGGERGHFYRPAGIHNWMSSEHLTVAMNISPEHGFQRFQSRVINQDGDVLYVPYNRFPIGGYILMKLATLPVSGNSSAQIIAARILMLLFFTATAVLVYISLFRITSNRWIALTATLLGFSSYYLLYYNDMTANEGMIDLFGVMLTFHGMVVFVQEGRFRQLLVKTCIALLLGWHVLALLLPFVIFGLASELLRARSANAASSITDIPKVKPSGTATLLRSRFLLLGIVALSFGMAVLTFNFTMEYVALNGETPLTELPSFQSMMSRSGLKGTGVGADFNPVRAGYLSWRPFLEGQFRSIFRMFIPYALLGEGDAAETPLWLPERGSVVLTSDIEILDARPLWLPKRLGGILGIALSAVCLIGSAFVRPRILFATLASFGFFWALPMRLSTAFHNFEAIYYIGLSLVFFTIVLLLARRLTSRDSVIVVASVAAAVLFAVSSFQVSRVVYSAETARATKAIEQDLLAIRELTAEERVTVLGLRGIRSLLFHLAGNAVHYYLNLILIDGGHPPSTGPRFVIMRHRIDTDALITPWNQYLFLYDAQGLAADLIASYRSAYPSVVSTEPLAREDFDVYLDDSTLYYIKEPCQLEDTRVTFFLHVFPEDLDDILDHRREHGFDNLDFLFIERGVMFDGKCMASADLPQYDVAGFRTGSHDDDGQEWTVSRVVQGPKLVSAYPSIVSGDPIARSEFDLYIDGGKLYYVKEPCGGDDVQDGFFLHIVPVDLGNLPDVRKQHGFDNLDFEFDVRGVLFDGKCLASIDLPQYGIAQITTGQYDGVDRIWEVELGPDALE